MNNKPYSETHPRPFREPLKPPSHVFVPPDVADDPVALVAAIHEQLARERQPHRLSFCSELDSQTVSWLLDKLSRHDPSHLIDLGFQAIEALIVGFVLHYTRVFHTGLAKLRCDGSHQQNLPDDLRRKLPGMNDAFDLFLRSAAVYAKYRRVMHLTRTDRDKHHAPETPATRLGRRPGQNGKCQAVPGNGRFRATEED